MQSFTTGVDVKLVVSYTSIPGPTFIKSHNRFFRESPGRTESSKKNFNKFLNDMLSGVKRNMSRFQ